MPDLRNVTRLAIIRLSSIGDVTHALPLSAALRTAYPNLQLTWIVEEMSADIVTGNPHLHDVIVIPRSRWKAGRVRSPRVWMEYARFLASLRRRRFEVTLDLQGYAKSALLALASGAEYRFGWWRLRDGANLVSRPLPRRPESHHRVDWFLDVARAFGIEPATVEFPIHIPDEARAYSKGLLMAAGIDPDARFAVLNPAVGNETRRWGASRYAELASRLDSDFGLQSVLVGSQKDWDLNAEVRTLSAQFSHAGGAAVVNIAGKTTLKQLAAVLDMSAVHICGDTGSAHIAAALGTPVVALYGPTDPSIAGPWGQERNVLARRDICKAECNVRQCAVDPVVARCLSEISVHEVLKKVGDNL